MAVAFDVCSALGTGTTSTVSTANFAIGNNFGRMLMIGIRLASASDEVTSVKWNTTETATRILGPIGANSECLYIYALMAPTATTANITVAQSASSGVDFYGACYYNVNQSVTFDVTGSTSGSGTTATKSVTTVTNKDWLFSAIRGFGATAWTASTNTTQRDPATNNTIHLGDTNADQTPAGAHAQTWVEGGSAQTWIIGVVGMAPASPITATVTDTVVTSEAKTYQRNAFKTLTDTVVTSDSENYIADRWKAQSKGTSIWTAQNKSI